VKDMGVVGVGTVVRASLNLELISVLYTLDEVKPDLRGSPWLLSCSLIFGVAVSVSDSFG
jgi:hypothetical protein